MKCLLPPSYFLFIWQLPQHPVFNYFSPAADASHSNLLWITPLRTNVLWQTPLFQSITRPKSAISLPAKHTPTSNGTSFSLRGCNCRRWEKEKKKKAVAPSLCSNYVDTVKESKVLKKKKRHRHRKWWGLYTVHRLATISITLPFEKAFTSLFWLSAQINRCAAS